MQTDAVPSAVADPLTPRTVAASGRALPPRTAADRFAWAGVALLTGGVLLALLVINDVQFLATADLNVVTAIFDAAHRAPVLVDFAAFCQRVGSSNVTTPVVVVVVVVLLLARRPGWAGWLAASAIGGLIISESFKHLVHRERPVWADPFFSEKGFSFPSGHTLSGITAWVAMGLVALYLLPRMAGTVVGWIVIAFGVLMGPSRLLYGVHWPSDVLAGWLFGFGWLLIVIAMGLVLVYRRGAQVSR